MGYSILSFLFAWTMPTKKDRAHFRELCSKIDARKKAAIIQKRYKNVSGRIKNKEKIKVLFLVNEISKWKTQSLYDLLFKSDNFEPIIAITIADIQRDISVKEKEDILNTNQEFFKQKRMNTVIAYDINKDKAVSLKVFKPDIIFYQQPYHIPKIQTPQITSEFALNCYISYYVPNYKNLELELNYDFHKYLYRYYVLDDSLAGLYKNYYLNNEQFEYDSIKAVGHTMFDNLRNQIKDKSNGSCVIYAPHWSISAENNENNLNLSTFNETGKFILDYARRHPEIKWIFKPHPTLKTALLRIGEMSEKEIDDYYSEWEKFAKCCYNSEYIELFNKSTAMITDCGSFLLEYFVTGKPLIRLVSQNNTNSIHSHCKKIFSTFYEAGDLSELSKVLDEVIVNKQDPLRTKRNTIINSLDFIKINAAENIMADLEEIVRC
ncbi:MAG: hypothetical protein LUG16_01980 [Candidatus Gastranaerophilales bacterium]|nr:hypothetical protein [Candidatus Gastranaerophilales bacterium]